MHALRCVTEEEGITFSEEEYVEQYLPLNDRDCFKLLWDRNARPLESEEVAMLIKRKTNYYFEAIRERNVLFDGATEAIRSAAARGPVAIASGAQSVEIRHILVGAGLLESFETIVAAEDVSRGKPDPEPFRLAYDRLRSRCPDLQMDECVAVEDSLGGIQSAQAAGLRCLGVAHSYPRRRLEESKAQWVIDSISDFKEWLNSV